MFFCCDFFLYIAHGSHRSLGGASQNFLIIGFIMVTALVKLSFRSLCLPGCMSINRKMWKMSVWMRPVIQVTDLMRTVGYVLSPQIARPFLGEYVNECNCTNTNTDTTATADQVPPTVQFAYCLMSVLDIIMFVLCMSMCAWSTIRSNRELSRSIVDAGNDHVDIISEDSSRLLNSEDTLEPSSRKSSSDSQRRLVVPRYILLSISYLLLIMYGPFFLLYSLLYTYLYEYLAWSVYASTLLVTMAGVMRLIFGAIVAVITRWLSPTWLSIIDLVNFFTFSVLVLLGSVGYGDAFTAIGVIFISATLGNVYPATITLVEETIHVTAPVMALFTSANGVAFVILGPVAGALLHKTGAMSLPLLLIACSLAASVLFVIYFILTRVTFAVYKHVSLEDSSSNDSSDE